MTGPAIPDLAGLSVDELEATRRALGEQANQITMAAEIVTAEIARRRVAVDPEKHATFDDRGAQALQDAVAAAPEIAKIIVAERDAAELADQAALTVGGPADLTDEEQKAVSQILGR